MKKFILIIFFIAPTLGMINKKTEDPEIKDHQSDRSKIPLSIAEPFFDLCWDKKNEQAKMKTQENIQSKITLSRSEPFFDLDYYGDLSEQIEKLTVSAPLSPTSPLHTQKEMKRYREQRKKITSAINALKAGHLALEYSQRKKHKLEDDDKKCLKKRKEDS